MIHADKNGWGAWVAAAAVAATTLAGCEDAQKPIVANVNVLVEDEFLTPETVRRCVWLSVSLPGVDVRDWGDAASLVTRDFAVSASREGWGASARGLGARMAKDFRLAEDHSSDGPFSACFQPTYRRVGSDDLFRRRYGFQGHLRGDVVWSALQAEATRVAQVTAQQAGPDAVRVPRVQVEIADPVVWRVTLPKPPETVASGANVPGHPCTIEARLSPVSFASNRPIQCTGPGEMRLG